MSDSEQANGAAEQANGAAEQAPKGPRVKWDDKDLSTSYANVCNVSSTREEAPCCSVRTRPVSTARR